MKVGRLGSHAFLIVGFSGLANYSRAADPFVLNPKKIIESGMAMPDGKVFSVIGSTYARSGPAYSFVGRSSSGTTAEIFHLHRSRNTLTHVVSLYDTPTMEDQMYSSTLRQLDVSDNSTTVTAARYDADPYDGVGNLWIGRRYALDKSEICSISGYSSSHAHQGNTWTNGESRGVYGDGMIYLYNSGSSSYGGSNDGIEILHVKKNLGPAITSGNIHNDYSSPLTYYGYPLATSRIDPETSTFLVSTRDTERGFRSLKFSNGSLSEYHSGLLSTPDSRLVRMPAGRWKHERVSGKTEFFNPEYSETYGGALAMYGSSGLKIIHVDGEKMNGLGISDAIYGEQISHFGDSALWLGRIGSQTGAKFLALYHQGESKKIIGRFDPLFGSKVVDLAIVPESLDKDGFSFYYRLLNNRTGIAHSSAVPEPGTLAALGLGALLLKRRKR